MFWTLALGSTVALLIVTVVVGENNRRERTRNNNTQRGMKSGHPKCGRYKQMTGIVVR